MTRDPDTLSERRIAEVFRALADEHADRRLEADRRRAEARLRAADIVILNEEPSRTFRLEPSRAYRLLLRRVLPAIAAAFMAWGLALWLSAEPLLEYTVEGATLDAGQIRTADGSARIRFSDTSSIDAEPHTTLAVEVVGERAALARLLKGKLRVAIHHDDDTDYRFLVGPYEVRVVGTQFHLAWDPEPARLSLAMIEGKVRVVGPDKLDRVLVAGQTLELERPKPTRPADATASQPPPTRSHAESRGGRTTPPPSENPAPATPTWATLLAAGRFEDVVREANAEGIARAHAARSAADLRALAQAAAYTGRTDLAVKTWMVVRQRFRGRSAEQAAFFLGRLYDQNGRSADALTWLRTYLREAPHGVYASEALGGVLTIVRRTEGNTAAKPFARTYLERFPKGSYAAAARAVLDGQ